MELNARHVQLIEEGQRLRGWITNAYAQIEFLLGDLIVRSWQFPEYDELPQTLPHDATKRIKRARSIIELPGPLSPYASELEAVIEDFETRHQTRNLLAHGFCTFLLTPKGDAGLEFQKWHRHPERQDACLVRRFRLDDLEREKDRFTSAAQHALTLFVRIHDDFGWIE